MRTWKSMAVLPLGKDPPATTSLSFNHNGKLFATVATDGVIYMFALELLSFSLNEWWPGEIFSRDTRVATKNEAPTTAADSFKPQKPNCGLNQRKLELDRTLLQAAARTSPIIGKTTSAPSICDFHYLYV